MLQHYSTRFIVGLKILAVRRANLRCGIKGLKLLQRFWADGVLTTKELIYSNLKTRYYENFDQNNNRYPINYYRFKLYINEQC